MSIITNIMRHFSLLVLLVFSLSLTGKESNRMGEVFFIEEESLEEFIRRSLSKQELSIRLEKVKETLLEQAKNPTPVKGLKESKKTKTSLLDPTYTLQEDFKDEKGKIIAKAGTKINPLKHIKLKSGLLFIDGDQQKHVDWARRQEGTFKWILVKGKPFELETHEKRPIFFDQGGKYASRFKIENIPVKIVQKGAFLLVKEYSLENR